MSRAHAPGRGAGRCPMRVLPDGLTDKSQPPVPSGSKCAHFQLASLVRGPTRQSVRGVTRASWVLTWAIHRL